MLGLTETQEMSIVILQRILLQKEKTQLRMLASETWQDCPNLNGETVKDILCRKVTLGLLPLLWKTRHPGVLATRIEQLMWEFFPV